MTDQPSGARDFDFFYGTWKNHNRRLVDGQWREFEATSTCTPILLGRANMDFFRAEMNGAPFEALSLRLFDPQTGLWRIWWIPSRQPDIDSPVSGRFEQGVGTFYGEEEQGGKMLHVKFIWDEITPSSARWRQEVSTDGGKTWEANWIMEFTRVSEHQ